MDAMIEIDVKPTMTLTAHNAFINSSYKNMVESCANFNLLSERAVVSKVTLDGLVYTSENLKFLYDLKKKLCLIPLDTF